MCVRVHTPFKSICLFSSQMLKESFFFSISISVAVMCGSVKDVKKGSVVFVYSSPGLNKHCQSVSLHPTFLLSLSLQHMGYVTNVTVSSGWGHQ